MAFNPFLAALEARQRAEDEEEDNPIRSTGSNPFLEALSARDKEQAAYAERQAEEEARRLVEESQSEKNNERSGLKKAFDQFNPFDSGRDWARAEPSAEGAAKSTFQQAKEGASALAEPFIKTANKFGAVQGGGFVEKQVDKLDKVLADVRKSNISEAEKSTIEDRILQTKTELLQGTLKKSGINQDDSALDIGRKTTADIVQAGSTVIAPGAGVIAGATAGVVGGVAAELAEDDPTLQGAAISGLAGGALGGIAGGLGSWLTRRNAAKEAIESGVASVDNTITDPARLLPDGTQSRAIRIAEIDDEINQIRTNPNYEPPASKELGEFSTVADDPNAQFTGGQTKTDGELDMRYGASKKAGVTAAQGPPKLNNKAARAKELFRERDKLLKEIDEIKDPNTRLAEEYIATENKVAQATQTGNQRKIDAATQEQAFMGEQIRLQDNQQAGQAKLDGLAPDSSVPLETGAPRVAGQAESIELSAIKKGLVDSVEDKAMYGSVNWDDQFARAKFDADADFNTAVRIATGEQEPPPGMLRNAYTEIVRDRAESTGNVEIIEAIARGEGASMTSRAAQELGILGAAARDRNSAVAAIRRVNQVADKVNKSKSGIGEKVTKLQAQELTNLYKQAKVLAQDVSTPQKRDAYAEAFIKARDYEQSLIDNMKPKGLAATVKAPKKFERLSGLAKTAVTTLDNSVIGRQGWKTMFTYPKQWAEKSLKSFADIARTVGGKEVLQEVRIANSAEPLFIDGTFQKMGLDLIDLGLQHEEAFPIDIGKVKGLGVFRRFPKAANEAYTAWQQRMRVDLAKIELQRAVTKGVDITDPNELKMIGNYVNTVTSRGKLKTMGKSAETLNNYFFSPKLMRSNFDFLTAMRKQDTSPYVRRRAAENLLKTIAGSATSLTIASALLGGKTELDPRSSDFGKLKIGDTRFDFTGGMGGFATLFARGASIPFEWAGLTSGSVKSSNTGELKPLLGDGYNAKDYTQTLVDFFTNKAAPLAGIGVNIANGGRDFEGNKLTVKSVVSDLTVPLIIRDYNELKNHPRSANAMAAMIASGLGISTNTYSMDSNWNANNGKAVNGFEKAVSKKSFTEANDKFNTQFNDWYEQVSTNNAFWKLPMEKREQLVNQKKTKLTEEVMAAYGYKYKQDRTKDDNDRLGDALLNYYR